MKSFVKGFNTYTRVNENDSEMEEPFRLYGRGRNPQQELIKSLKELINLINRMNPRTQEEFDQMKLDIKNMSDDIKSHPNYEEFKTKGFDWQEQVIMMSDWKEDFDRAILKFYQKASKRRLV